MIDLKDYYWLILGVLIVAMGAFLWFEIRKVYESTLSLHKLIIDRAKLDAMHNMNVTCQIPPTLIRSPQQPQQSYYVAQPQPVYSSGLHTPVQNVGSITNELDDLIEQASEGEIDRLNAEYDRQLVGDDDANDGDDADDDDKTLTSEDIDKITSSLDEKQMEEEHQEALRKVDNERADNALKQIAELDDNVDDLIASVGGDTSASAEVVSVISTENPQTVELANKYTLTQLKELATKYKVSGTGKKTKIIERLMEVEEFASSHLA